MSEAQLSQDGDAADGAAAVRDLGLALLRLPETANGSQRQLIAATARCLCTALQTAESAGASAGGSGGASLALRLVRAVDGLLVQCRSRDLATEASLDSLASQIEQWCKNGGAPPAASTGAGAADGASDSMPAAAFRGLGADGDDAALLSGLRARIADGSADVRAQLRAEDAAVAEALIRRLDAKEAARRGAGAGGRWATIAWNFLAPLLVATLSVAAAAYAK